MVLRGDAEDLGGGGRKEKKKKEKKNKVKKGSHSFAEVDEVWVKKKKEKKRSKRNNRVSSGARTSVENVKSQYLNNSQEELAREGRRRGRE